MENVTRLDGKVAVISGGASGIGAAAAARLAAAGASVVVGDVVSPNTAADDARFVTLDVTSSDSWRELRETVLSAFGRVDVLINSAGIFRDGMTAEISATVWDRVVAVNQTGTFLGMQTFADSLASDGGGSIVNLSSYAGMQGHGTSIAYSATKWAVRGMTRFAAREFAPRGVRVNAIVPGFIDTPMVQAASQQLRDSAVRRTPLGRLGSVAEVAEAIAFLASDDSAFITGTEIVIDGGILA
jgi:NAD(P)-dependent dehydrogenase (short-subunit alcohol dehydrogenase family)